MFRYSGTTVSCTPPHRFPACLFFFLSCNRDERSCPGFHNEALFLQTDRTTCGAFRSPWFHHCPVDLDVMHSLAQEIQGFSKARLKKQCTHVTTVTGRKLLERRKDGAEGETEEVEEIEEGTGCGFVEDQSLDLQVGIVRPFLLLASQDAAHDIETLQRCKVSHVLNVAYGVANLFPDQLVYKTLNILDLPDTDITSYLGDCSSFIDQAREQSGVVLVHCNAGVSRSSSIVIGYLMLREGLSFEDAYRQVKDTRPSICPNPGFYKQLQNFKL